MTRSGRLFTLLVCTVLMTACGGDDDAPPAPVETLSVNVSDLYFTAEGGTQSFNITASGEWRISGQPEWINVSPQRGQGNSIVTVTVNTTNFDSASRTGTLTVALGEKSVDVEVSQAGAYAACTATVKNMVVLAHSLAFQMECTSDVKNVRCGWVRASYVQSHTEQELVDWMKGAAAYMPDDGVYFWEDVFESDTDYYILTLAYDRNDKMGKLHKFAFRTKSDVNQCIVGIDDVQYWTSGKMTWQATPDNNGDKYYSIYLNGLERELGSYYPTYLAWFMYQEIKKGNSAIVQKHVGAGEVTETSGYKLENDKLVPQQAVLHGLAQIVTWGENLDGELSGVINNRVGFLNLYSVRPRSVGSAQKGTFKWFDYLESLPLRGGIRIKR